jgi:hypothetical protein
MKALRDDPVVRLTLKNRCLQIADIASFVGASSATRADGISFLDDLDRVADRNYTVTVTDDCILHSNTICLQYKYMIVCEYWQRPVHYFATFLETCPRFKPSRLAHSDPIVNHDESVLGNWS